MSRSRKTARLAAAPRKSGASRRLPNPERSVWKDGVPDHQTTVARLLSRWFIAVLLSFPQKATGQAPVSGFVEPIVKELPLEYAVELNRLILLQMEGSVG
jgi:hypothetical protein